MERIKRHLRSAAGYLLVCAKWLALAALVGCVVGPLGAAFGLALNWANATRAAQPWLLYLLPAAGLVIVFLGPLVHLVSLPLLKNSLLVQLDQTGQVLVAVVCNLLVASEQLLSTLGEGAGQTAVTQGEKVDRDEVEPHHFESWIQWAKENDFKLDFNSTSFSHPKSGDLTLANPSDDIRNFWIEHTKRCRWISDEMGKAQNDPCMMNLWIHDGSKEVPASRLRYRRILEESLDEIFATEYKWMKDCIEAKLFGIGLESYTVGSYDFYLGYGAKKNKIVTLDTGHFHLTESIADKVSALLLFTPEIMLHVSRPIRWDSDHVLLFDDETREMAKEIVRNDALDRVYMALDYFDASINRISAWAVGLRSWQKALLYAMLSPNAALKALQDENKLTELMMMQEEVKTLPFGDGLRRSAVFYCV